MKNFVGILILVLVVILVFEFYHRKQLSVLNSQKGGLETKLTVRDKKIDSLQAVIRKGRTNLERTRIKGKPANVTDIVNDIEEYLNSMEEARAFEKRGKDITADELYAKAEKYKLEVMKLFSKDSEIVLVLDTENGFSHEYMFNQENWKLITRSYSSLRPEKKPKEWITEDKILKIIENLEPGKKYKVKFKVLETIHMPYTGTISYFSLHLKYLGIVPV